MLYQTRFFQLAAIAVLGVLTACGGGGGDLGNGTGGGGGTAYTFTAVAGASGVMPGAYVGTFTFDSSGAVTQCSVGDISKCKGQLKDNILAVDGENTAGTSTVTFTGTSTSSPSSTDTNALIAGTISGTDSGAAFSGKFGGIKSSLLDTNMAKFAGVYGVTATTTVNGAPDTTHGHFSVDVTGKMFKCKVGNLVKCQGQLSLNPDPSSATFTLSGNDGLTPAVVSATLKGTIDSSFKTNGAITGTVVEGGSTSDITGTFTGGKN